MINTRRRIKGRTGEYLLLQQIATGKRFAIYVALKEGESGPDRFAVVREILPELAEDKSVLSRFMKEAKLTSRFDHAHVARIFEMGKLKGVIFAIMEYMAGDSLAFLMTQVSTKGQQIPVDIAAGIAAQAADGLNHIHHLKDAEGKALNLVHRYANTRNLILTPSGEVKIFSGDVLGDDKSPEHTHDPAYFSPEQMAGQPLNSRSDIFSLGVVLFEALSGTRLFHRSTDNATRAAVSACHIPKLKELRADVPDTLALVAERALQPQTDKRYATAGLMNAALRRFAASKDKIARYLQEELGERQKARQELLDKLIESEDATVDSTFLVPNQEIRLSVHGGPGNEPESKAAEEALAAQQLVAKARPEPSRPVPPPPPPPAALPSAAPAKTEAAPNEAVVAEEPIAEEPIAEEPIAEEPTAEEPIAEEPIAEKPIAEEPIAEEPTAEEPIAEEPSAPPTEEVAPEQQDALATAKMDPVQTEALQEQSAAPEAADGAPKETPVAPELKTTLELSPEEARAMAQASVEEKPVEEKPLAATIQVAGPDGDRPAATDETKPPELDSETAREGPPPVVLTRSLSREPGARSLRDFWMLFVAGGVLLLVVVMAVILWPSSVEEPSGTELPPVVVDAPADTPVDTPADAPADAPADTPADAPVDAPADPPADAPADEPADTPADEPADTPADEPADTPADAPADAPVDTPADAPADEPQERGTTGATIDIISDPAKCEAWVGNDYIRQFTPIKNYPVKVGVKQFVAVKCKGFKRGMKAIVPQAGENLKLEFVLDEPETKAAFGKLQLNTEPWTEVYHGKRKLGITPLLGVRLPAGKQKLQLVNRGENINKLIVVDIKPGKKTSLFKKL